MQIDYQLNTVIIQRKIRNTDLIIPVAVFAVVNSDPDAILPDSFNILYFRMIDVLRKSAVDKILIPVEIFKFRISVCGDQALTIVFTYKFASFMVCEAFVESAFFSIDVNWLYVSGLFFFRRVCTAADHH